MGRVGSQRAKGTLYRLVKDSKITIWVPCEDSNLKQSAQTRRSQLGGGFRALHSVLVYFHVPRRGAVQIAHTSVSPSGTSAYARIVFAFMFWVFAFSFYFDTSNKPLNRSQTRRPDPFQVSAVTTRGLCQYSSGDCICSFSPAHGHSKSKNTRSIAG